MAIERFSENLTLNEMKCTLGDNGWGAVYPQGDVPNIKDIDLLLKKAGGKPKQCPIDDYTMGGNGKAKPEYIITFNDDAHTIIVVECKNTVKKHQSENLDCPSGYAVDGVLYYAKFLKEKYNVIAIAISGTAKETMKVDAFYWGKKLATYDSELLKKSKNLILEPKNYIKLRKGESLQKEYSLREISLLAIEMHNSLRAIAVREEHKPIFIAGVLIALSDDDFCKTYPDLRSFKLVMQNIQSTIEAVLTDNEIKNDRRSYIKNIFKILQDNTKFASIPLIEEKSILWYIRELEMKIKPMMDHADNSLDALGVFYHEFIKYSGGDGSGLGIVITPQHLTEFMCELAGVNKNSTVVDICCGSGSFLVTAMSKMFKVANPKETKIIRKERLFGVEQDDGMYTLTITNMIIRKDGKSNIFKGDCFDPKITNELKSKKINVGLMNPPYSLKGDEGKKELEFVEQLLDILAVGGKGVVVVPMSCAIGTKFKDIRERLFQNHTLRAVFSMPDDIFYPTAGTNPCVMVWEAHRPHNSKQETFFGYCKYDGFVKRKKLGRIDDYNRWPSILEEWLKLYSNRDVVDGLSARACVTHKDEWLCEAYMKTDYALLSLNDFGKSVREFLAYQIFSGISDLSIKYKRTQQLPLSDTKTWHEFSLEELFTFVKGKRLRKEDMSPGNTNYIGAISLNNGIRQLIDVEPIFKPYCITVNYNGSVGEAYYQIVPFWATDDVNVLYAKGWEINEYIALFITTIIQTNKFRFSYGRKWTMDKMKKSLIKLPITPLGSPDWDYMTRFVKSLPYADTI